MQAAGSTEPNESSDLPGGFRRPPFGAILAGGASIRFGSPKALARIGGLAIVERVERALREAVDEVVLIANEPTLFVDRGLRCRADIVPGRGALSGIHAALAWAREEGRPGALCIACDMPFIRPALLRAMLTQSGDPDLDAVVPESAGKLGFEPLCAYYSVSAIDALSRMLLSAESRVSALPSHLRTARISIDRVRGIGDPEVIFLNVNTPDDYEQAVKLAAENGQ
ncbi:MAG: Molybdopterin-guanine dinucleotide biosynthesis protein [Gemmatimonadetes bacterium]|nr:Molybdopterin-guanine dinucleotide biosynthesis protein [Gemmatimonadota bacterium]